MLVSRQRSMHSVPGAPAFLPAGPGLLLKAPNRGINQISLTGIAPAMNRAPFISRIPYLHNL